MRLQAAHQHRRPLLVMRHAENLWRPSAGVCSFQTAVWTDLEPMQRLCGCPVSVPSGAARLGLPWPLGDSPRSPRASWGPSRAGRLPEDMQRPPRENSPAAPPGLHGPGRRVCRSALRQRTPTGTWDGCCVGPSPSSRTRLSGGIILLWLQHGVQVVFLHVCQGRLGDLFLSRGPHPPDGLGGRR